MKLGTIILNWRTPDMTLKAVESALRESERIDGAHRLVIVDNDSQDGSFEKMRDAVAAKAKSSDLWKTVEVLQSCHNGGFGAGNNYGIRHLMASKAPPEYIYILNSDAFPEEDAIKHLVDYLDGHPEAGVAGSYIHGTDGVPHTTAFRFPSIQSEIEGSLRLGVVSRAFSDFIVPIGIPEKTQPVDWLAGASFLVRRSILERVGLFDETFFLYFEETDLCRRIRDAGFEIIYVLESSVAHIGSVSTGMKEWNKTPDYWFDSRRHYFLKNHGRGYMTAATLARMFGSSVWQIRRRLQSKEDEDPPGFLQGLTSHSLRLWLKERLPR